MRLLALALLLPLAALADKPVDAGPYVPSPQSVVSKMLEYADVGAQDFLVDLGSGDGRIVRTAALVFGCVMLFEAFFYGVSVAGYPSVIVGLMVLGGVQLIMIGVVGEYIGKVLSEIKARPVYFIAEHEVRSAQDHRAAHGEPPPVRTAAE